MLERLKGAALLHGFRGSPPVDIEQCREVIGRLSEFAADQRERIAELDVNPLICAGNRIVAVDALPSAAALPQGACLTMMRLLRPHRITRSLTCRTRVLRPPFDS